jgi:hypothetical protein
MYLFFQVNWRTCCVEWKDIKYSGDSCNVRAIVNKFYATP